MRTLSLLVPFAVAATVALAGTAVAQAPTIRTLPFVSGLARPNTLTAPPQDVHRVFICEQHTGNVRLVKDGVLQATPFINVGAVSTGNEQGLLGLAFHPDYETNGFFYVNLTNAGGTTIIRRYTRNAGNPDLGDPATALQIMQIAQPFSNHNGGCIQFGPDGYLYIGMGDGGSGNDPGNNAQTITSLLGKMLRIDVNSDDFPADATRFYAIPPTNPFAGATPGADEVWHLGLRNPWRWSFDRFNGNMFIGDVGQDAWEELSFAPAGQGFMNFGWRCMEGNNCTVNGGCTCDLTGATLTLAFHHYAQNSPPTSGSCTVIGGFVYRGNDIPALQGTYFFTDYCLGRLWTTTYAGFGSPGPIVDRTVQLDPPGAPTISFVTSFGEDARGELYIVEQDGQVWRIVGEGNGFPFCASDGTLVDHTTPCPCGNTGGTGRGCANSIEPLGALITATGTTGSNNVVLTAAGMPLTAFSLFIQHNALADAVFHDGVICAGGTLVRLRGRGAVGGVATFPNTTFPEDATLTLSSRGGVTVGSGARRYYAAFYRNASTTFCPPATANVTNGWILDW